MNIASLIGSIAEGAGISARIAEPNCLILESPQMHHELTLVRLVRPTPKEVETASGENCLLVITEPSRAARLAAMKINHVSVPNGDLRIVLPGMVLITPEISGVRRHTPAVRLRGASGRIAESLLLHPKAHWVLRNLAQDAKVSLGLAQKVIERLKREGLVSDPGADPNGRGLTQPDALLKLWAQADHEAGSQFAAGYMYAPNPLDSIRKIQEVIPGICAGGALAANSYVARLSLVPAPYKVWVPQAFANREKLRRVGGLEIVQEGANLVFQVATGDPWSVHAEEWNGVLRISKPRCFVELYESTGRLQELAEAILEAVQ